MTSTSGRWLVHGSLELRLKNRAPLLLPLHRPHYREEDFYVQIDLETSEHSSTLIIDLHPKVDELILEKAVLRWPTPSGSISTTHRHLQDPFTDGYLPSAWWQIRRSTTLKADFAKHYRGKHLGQLELRTPDFHAIITSADEKMAWSAFSYDTQGSAWVLERDFEQYPLRHSLILAHLNMDFGAKRLTLGAQIDGFSEETFYSRLCFIDGASTGSVKQVFAKAEPDNPQKPLAGKSICIADANLSLEEIHREDFQTLDWRTFVKTCRDAGQLPGISAAPYFFRQSPNETWVLKKSYFSRGMKSQVHLLDFEQIEAVRLFQQAIQKMLNAGMEAICLPDFGAFLWNGVGKERTRAQLSTYIADLLGDLIGNHPLVVHDLPDGLLADRNLLRLDTAPAQLHSQAKAAKPSRFAVLSREARPAFSGFRQNRPGRGKSKSDPVEYWR